ncbi:MAG TPA: PQQ-dependent sugar dehydrogenase [Nitrososphaeraceae archaeon]|nr:PQQ-dependent sugar dehydrogenase [Nitrososphaeraceae archaeon]
MVSIVQLVCTLALIFSLLVGGHFNSADAQPIFKDPDLGVESIVEEGLSSPTSMAFISNNGILVLEKNSGEVRLVSNGALLEEPVMKLDVDATTLTCCRGLLGIANIENEIFLYFSEAAKDGQPVRNRLYKYQWNDHNHTLTNPELILELPATPGPNHPGGKITIGKDHYLYTVIGDLNNEGQLQNIEDGPEPNDSSVILKIGPEDGSPANDNPFLSNAAQRESQMDKYYAYGIRNSFGLAIDPVTGYLWEAENGDRDYDEVNIVRPGFNGGWKKLMGPISESEVTEEDLVNFPNSHYSDPVFSWNPSLGITDIEFLSSSKLGSRYTNNIFVGDITNGNLYFFEVNKTRTGLTFDNPDIQEDLMVDNEEQLESITLGTGFGGITDIETGPDGFLYVLTFDQESEGEGKIYKILPSGNPNV